MIRLRRESKVSERHYREGMKRKMGSTYRTRVDFKDEDRPESNYAEMFVKLARNWREIIFHVRFSSRGRFDVAFNLPSLTKVRRADDVPPRGREEGSGKKQFFERRASLASLSPRSDFSANVAIMGRRSGGREDPKSNKRVLCREVFARMTPECARFPYHAAANRIVYRCATCDSSYAAIQAANRSSFLVRNALPLPPSPSSSAIRRPQIRDGT